MAGNLIGILESLLSSGDVLSRLGALVGLSPERTKSTIGAAVPAILAALVSLVQKPSGRDQLAAVVRDQDPGLLDNLSGMLSGGREKSLIDTGRNALTSLFGQSTLGSLAGAIGKYAGVDQGSTTSLLGALAPAVMGALGREQRAQGLDAQGLARLLNDQKDSIAHALPTGLAKELGSTGLLEGIADRLGEGVSTVSQAARSASAGTARTASVAATTAAGVAGSAAHTARHGGSSWLRWLIGLLVLLALIWLAYHFLFRREVEEAVAPTTAPVTENLQVGDVNVGERVSGVFGQATTALNDVTDAASAEAALPRLTEINSELDNLSGMVGQLPAEGKSALASLINSSLPELEALIAKVTEIPGVGAVIKPVADAMLENLRGMAA